MTAAIKVKAAPMKPPLSLATAAARAVSSAAARVALHPPTAPPPSGQQPIAPLTVAQMNTQAGSSALAALKPQQQNVITQQTAAALQAKHDEQAIVGLNKATAAALSGIAPSIQGAYSGAARDIGQLAQGFSGQMADTARADNSSAESFAASQGQNPGQLGPNAEQIGNVAYGQGGYIPGTSFAENAANASMYGAGIVGANAASGRTDLDARISQGHTDDIAFRKQLTDLATQYPALRDAALQALQAHELQVGNYNLNVAKTNDSITNADAASHRADVTSDFNMGQASEASDRAETTMQANIAHIQTGDKNAIATTRANIKHLFATDKINAAAEARLEKYLDYTIDHGHTQETIDQDTLTLRNKTYQLAVDKAAKDGQQFDKNLSIAAGFAVDKNRQPILTAAGAQIPVSAKSFKTATVTASRTPQARYQLAVRDAERDLGSPIKNTTGYGYTYVALIGATGTDVQPGVGNAPATTTNPKKAQSDVTKSFAEEVTFLMNSRGLTRSRARAAAIKAGWKPDGKRPTKTDPWLTTPNLG